MDSKEVTISTITIGENGEKKRDQQEMPMDIDDALNTTGFGLYQILLIFTCGMILYAVNTESYSISYILPAAQCDLELTVSEKSLLTSVGFLGIMSTQFFWGFISDTRGRKNCLFYTLMASFVFTVAAAFSPYLWLILLFRFLNGVMLSSASATVFTYVGEFFSPKYSSIAIMSSCIFIGLAITVLPCLAWLILPLDLNTHILGLNFTSWRLYLLLSGGPTVLACFGLFFFPESPKYLLANDKHDRAVEILARIHKVNTRNAKFPAMKLKYEGKRAEEENMLKDFAVQIFSLFGLKHLKNTLLACFLQFGIFWVSSGLLLWYPDILLQLSKGNGEMMVCEAMAVNATESATNDDAFGCDEDLPTSMFMQNIWVGLVYLVGYSVISSIINFAGIKPILFSFVGCAGVCGFALLWTSNQLMINILFVGMLVLCGICVGVVNAAVVQLFPTRLRAMSACVSMFCGRMGSVVSSSIVGYLLKWNCQVTFSIYSGVLIACSLLSLLIPIGRKT